MRRAPEATQGGAAILTAMLTVVLVASLASATLWQQWRGVEVEAAERSRTQSAWVLVGALDWARLILREDGRKGGADHLAEPWAVPLAQARLSTFLAADRSDALAAEEMQAAFLSGQIVDLQSRLNVTNLVVNGQADTAGQLAFERLFRTLNLPEAELQTMTLLLAQAQAARPSSAIGRAQRANGATAASAVNDGNATLWPQTLDQLAWVGLSAPTLARLRPFITLLPARTPVNLNTAPAEVIFASVAGLDLADANRLVQARTNRHFATLAEASEALGKAAAVLSDNLHSVNSRFFEVQGTLRMDQVEVQEQSVVQRDGLDVKTLWRQRGVAPAKAPLQ
jgi:general secretion pathway protein K